MRFVLVAAVLRAEEYRGTLALGALVRSQLQASRDPTWLDAGAADRQVLVHAPYLAEAGVDDPKRLALRKELVEGKALVADSMPALMTLKPASVGRHQLPRQCYVCWLRGGELVDACKLEVGSAKWAAKWEPYEVLLTPQDTGDDSWLLLWHKASYHTARVAELFTAEGFHCAAYDHPSDASVHGALCWDPTCESEHQFAHAKALLPQLPSQVRTMPAYDLRKSAFAAGDHIEAKRADGKELGEWLQGVVEAVHYGAEAGHAVYDVVYTDEGGPYFREPLVPEALVRPRDKWEDTAVNWNRPGRDSADQQGHRPSAADSGHESAVVESTGQ